MEQDGLEPMRKIGRDGDARARWCEGTDIAFVLVATVLMAVVDVLFYTLIDGKPLKGFLILGANYMMAIAFWLVLRLASLIHLRKLLQWSLGLIISLYCCLLAFCWYRFGTPMDKGMIALVTGTNHAEAREFFQTYITPATAIGFIGAVLLVFAVFLFITNRRFSPSAKLLKGMGIGVLAGCCCLGYSFYTLPGRIEGILRTEQKELTNYLQHPQMVETTSSHPDIVMIVIGESFVRSHSSLYGYDKPTNPRLQQLADSGRLVVFRDPVAPATHTAEAFKHFMTTLTHETQGKEWYECLTLTEALACAGYQTSWFSNQAQSGWYDNVSAAFAKTCQSVHYTTTAEDGEQDAKPDGILFSGIHDYLSQSSVLNSRHAVFVHLMGQHCNFSQRYPKAFARFRPSQYLSRPEEQREDFATYDNATLYNDYVVDSLLSMLKDCNAVAVYFSDHGMDFYESAPDYCSHANDNNPVSKGAGLKIPFVVYTTKKWQDACPAIREELEQMVSRPFNTEDLPDLVLKLTGYQTIRRNQ